MNIAMFTDCYVPIKNGVVTSVMELARGLRNKGHHVVILSVKVPGYVDKDEVVYRVPDIPIGLGTEQRFGFIWQPNINRFLKAHNIELIHTHTEFSLGHAGRAAAKKLRLPHIHTTHTMWEDYRTYILNGKLLTRGMIKWYLRYFLRPVYALISPSSKAKHYHEALLPDTPITIIPSGINVKHFKSIPFTQRDINEMKEIYGIAPDDFIAIFLGRLGKEKRVFELFDAMAKGMRDEPRLKTLFAGDGPALASLKKRARKADLADRFIFTGYVPWTSVYKIYSMADVFVNASLSETQGLTLVEAAYAGLPLVSIADECYDMIVKDGENGFLVESDEGIASSVRTLIDDASLRTRFSRKSLQIAKDFTLERFVDRVEAFYKKVLEHYPLPLPM